VRVLFACVPQTGHVTPVLPLAEAFQRRGDEVTVASGPDIAEVVSGRGLGFREAGPPFEAWFGGLLARTRGQPGDGLPPDRIERYFVPRLFGEVGAALMLDDLLTVARETRPDLLVFDSVTFAGPMVAATERIPAVFHAVGVLHHPDVVELSADAVSPMWRQLGLEAPRDAGLHGGTTVTIAPPTLDPPAAAVPRRQPLRPVNLPRKDAPRPDVLDGLAGQPIVYLTLGTFSNNLDLFRTLLEGLRDLPVGVVATVGRDVDPADLGALPANIRAERFVPQADLLPWCALVVHHAGAGTGFGVLAHGLPSVVLPQSADNFVIGQRIADAGAAVSLMPGQVSADSVREAVEKVLADDAFRHDAERIAREIAGMPGPDEVAALLAERA
jgi:UDP:flavonoid glycosyltransferase YjiC (YdhE family)